MILLNGVTIVINKQISNIFDANKQVHFIIFVNESNTVHSEEEAKIRRSFSNDYGRGPYITKQLQIQRFQFR